MSYWKIDWNALASHSLLDFLVFYLFACVKRRLNKQSMRERNEEKNRKLLFIISFENTKWWYLRVLLAIIKTSNYAVQIAAARTKCMASECNNNMNFEMEKVLKKKREENFACAWHQTGDERRVGFARRQYTFAHTSGERMIFSAFFFSFLFVIFFCARTVVLVQRIWMMLFDNYKST